MFFLLDFRFFFAFFFFLYLLRNGAQLRVAQRRLRQGHGRRGLDAVRGVLGPGDDVGEGGRGAGGSAVVAAGAAGAAVVLEQDAALREGVGACLFVFFFRETNSTEE